MGSVSECWSTNLRKSQWRIRAKHKLEKRCSNSKRSWKVRKGSITRSEWSKIRRKEMKRSSKNLKSPWKGTRLKSKSFARWKLRLRQSNRLLSQNLIRKDVRSWESKMNWADIRKSKRLVAILAVRSSPMLRWKSVFRRLKETIRSWRLRKLLLWQRTQSLELSSTSVAPWPSIRETNKMSQRHRRKSSSAWRPGLRSMIDSLWLASSEVWIAVASVSWTRPTSLRHASVSESLWHPKTWENSRVS